MARKPEKIAPSDAVRHVTTRRGVRLVQHGTVLSEVLRRPGATHTMADVLAALICMLAPPGRIGLLGFAGGATLAPLRALGCQVPIAAVDKSRDGWQVFRRLCRAWCGAVQVEHDDALHWLQTQAEPWAMLVDDLSITNEADVVKPEISWTSLPKLIQGSLQPDGVALFNLLTPPDRAWRDALASITSLFPQTLLILFQDFENRILVGGASLPTPRQLGIGLRTQLRKIKSRQAGQLTVRRIP